MDQDPKSWGPAAWTLIHWAAARADRENSQDTFFAFLRMLTQFLPCTKCRKHLKKNLTLVAVYPSSASRTAYQLHNRVNHDTGKDDFTCFSRVRAHYNKLAKDDPPLKIWPFLYSVATFCDTNSCNPRTATRFWKLLGRILPESWEFELPTALPQETMTQRLHRYHRARDPAALSLQHYVIKCTSGC